MDILIEITAAATRISGTSQNTGKPYSFQVQEGYVSLPKYKHPQRVEIFVADTQAEGGYPLGHYRLTDESFVLDRRGRLAVEPVLEPVAQRPQAVAGKG